MPDRSPGFGAGCEERGVARVYWIGDENEPWAYLHVYAGVHRTTVDSILDFADKYARDHDGFATEFTVRVYGNDDDLLRLQIEHKTSADQAAKYIARLRTEIERFPPKQQA